MELFHENGHLTDEALAALVRSEALPELLRLELAEHLAFCDACLDRYTALLDGGALLTPEHTCRDTLWWRLRQRALRVFASRWTTAAAALAIVFTLWSFGVFGGVVDASSRLTEWEPPAVSQTIQNRPRQLGRAVSEFFSGLGRGLSDAMGGMTAPATSPSGGN